jgi:c-di-GMP-binding flagellar brake protein YcgR
MLGNRRRHPRIPFTDEIKVRVAKKDAFPLRCTNISMGGMCLRLAEEFERGSRGKLWLTRSYPEEAISFAANFKVVWVQRVPPGGTELCMGVAFGGMKRKDMDALLHLLTLQGTIVPEEQESQHT